ncbi:MAG: dihydrolipoyl dehydrogenase [Nitrospina sp.]|jgi:dihydrolipoamide dehydrogenase|nr:dihydrolipoyl dehydrogenase [Nitrospina sp.]MBT6718656.1 dihydrolipoyl dehydrogenase [Nitrospina sp.]
MSVKNLLVLGGGPGGYAAAFLAADKGMDVTLIDAGNKPGGVCLHRGCIPSKALLHIAHLINETKEAKSWGLDFGEPKIDLDTIRNRKNQIIDKMATGLTQLCKQRKVEFVSGKGTFKDSHTIEVDGRLYSFDHCILATGSRPTQPFNDISGLMDSTRALNIESVPKSLLVIGGGYIGMEMGSVYAALGSKVTVVEMMDGILTGVDRDLVRPLQHRIKNQFEEILLKTKVTHMENEGSNFSVTLENDSGKEQKLFDQVLVSIGRRPNTESLGLENTKIKLDDKGFVIADNQQKTADPHISAIGDVTGGAMLAHKASHEAKIAIEVLVGEIIGSNTPVMPAVVFTDPEIAWAGLTEIEAKAQNKIVSIAKFPWGASGRAQTLGRSEGLTKLIIDPESEKIIGVGLTGSGAGELIAEGVLAIETGAKAKDLASSVHPHPTLSETLMEAAEVFYGTATHVYKRKRE